MSYVHKHFSVKNEVLRRGEGNSLIYVITAKNKI